MADYNQELTLQESGKHYNPHDWRPVFEISKNSRWQERNHSAIDTPINFGSQAQEEIVLKPEAPVWTARVKVDSKETSRTIIRFQVEK